MQVARPALATLRAGAPAAAPAVVATALAADADTPEPRQSGHVSAVGSLRA